jgi:hypothetical protein
MRMMSLSMVFPVLSGCFHVVEPRQPVEAPASAPFSHDAWASVLDTHVSDGGLVDYAAIQADRRGLDTYVAQLAAASPDSHPALFPDDEARLAYWINAYNALAVLAVVDRPGLDKVVDNKVDFFYKTRYPLGGKPLSLYKLENGIVRERFDDPRIHFALNCQSASCPTFPNTPFPAEGLDERLDAETRAFIADPENVRLEGDVLHVSQIFEWYASDFEAAGGARAFVATYRDVPDDASIAYIPYDWTLIAQDGARP